MCDNSEGTILGGYRHGTYCVTIQYHHSTSCVAGRRENSGGTWEPSSQQVFGFVTVLCHDFEFPAANSTDFKN